MPVLPLFVCVGLPLTQLTCDRLDVSSTQTVMPVLRPSLRRGLTVIRRDDRTVQLGTDPVRATVLSVDSPQVAQLVAALDGRADLPTLARRHGLVPAVVAQVVAELAAAGVLEAAVTEPEPPAAVCDPAGTAGVPAHSGTARGAGGPGGRRLQLVADPNAALTAGACAPTGRGRSERTLRRREAAASEHRRRSQPDAAAWSLLDEPGTGQRQRSRRAGAVVAVTGGDRLGAAVSLLLASAGVGQVVCGDESPTRHGDGFPGGLGRDDVGRSRRAGLARRLRELSPSTRLLTEHPAPDVVVVTDGGADRDAVEALRSAGQVHLVLGARETLGVVGPFVVPGRTSCLRCHHLHRTDRDPGWPMVVDQLAAASRGPVGTSVVAGAGAAAGTAGEPAVHRLRGNAAGSTATEACDGVLATLIASTAALHVLTWLRGEVPPSVDGTVEFRLPDGTGRRRGWEPHPNCGCLRTG